MKPTITWIVIADGAEARVFANAGPGKGMHPVDGMHLSQAHLHNRDIMADKPGRSISSVGSGRSAIDYKTNPVDVREKRFVTHLAAVLEENHREGKFDRLIIAAAPSALGDIRPELGKDLQKVIVAELPKDLIKTPTVELPSHFSDLLAL